MQFTLFLAELMGLICIVVSLSILAQRKLFLEVVKDIEDSRGLLFMVGMISLLLGLLIVLTHNIWNAGFLATVVTLVGWVMIIRGVFALFVSHQDLVRLVRMAKLEKLSWFYGLLILVFGAYLAYAGMAGVV